MRRGLAGPLLCFATALLIAAVLGLGACEDEPDRSPPTCADWLHCYNSCRPWESLVPAVAYCDDQCRSELAYDPDRAVEPSAAVVSAELAARDPEDDRTRADMLQRSLVERGRCVDY